MATQKQLEALKKARAEKAKNRKKVRKVISAAKKQVKNTVSKTISIVRKTVTKATKKVLDSSVRKLKKQGLAGTEMNKKLKKLTTEQLWDIICKYFVERIFSYFASEHAFGGKPDFRSWAIEKIEAEITLQQLEDDGWL